MKTKRNLHRDLNFVCVYEWHINNKLSRTNEYNYRARRKLMMKFCDDIEIIYYVDPFEILLKTNAKRKESKNENE